MEPDETGERVKINFHALILLYLLFFEDLEKFKQAGLIDWRLIFTRPLLYDDRENLPLMIDLTLMIEKTLCEPVVDLKLISTCPFL